jgi:hypothetical protein
VFDRHILDQEERKKQLRLNDQSGYRLESKTTGARAEAAKAAPEVCTVFLRSLYRLLAAFLEKLRDS